MTNSQKVNPQNTRSLLIRKTSSTVNANNFEIGINCIKKVSSLQQKLLSFHLKFKSHIWNIFKKASQKSNALSRISFCMDHKKRKVIIKTYIKLFFGWTIIEQWIKKNKKNTWESLGRLSEWHLILKNYFNKDNFIKNPWMKSAGFDWVKWKTE